jgi:hypothetical protein
MKIIVTIIALAVGMVQTVARAAEEPAWSLEGRMIYRGQLRRRLPLPNRQTA